MILKLNGEYLLNETRYRQSGKDIEKYKQPPTLSQNFMKLADKRLRIVPEFLPTLSALGLSAT